MNKMKIESISFESKHNIGQITQSEASLLQRSSGTAIFGQLFAYLSVILAPLTWFNKIKLLFIKMKAIVLIWLVFGALADAHEGHCHTATGELAMAEFSGLVISAGGQEITQDLDYSDAGNVFFEGFTLKMEDKGYITKASTGSVENPSSGYHYASQVIGEGDFDVIVKVEENTALAKSAGAGIMVREILDSREPMKRGSMSVTVWPKGPVNLRAGNRHGSFASQDYFQDLVRFNPKWLRITRVGNICMAYSSNNGVDWEEHQFKRQDVGDKPVEVGLVFFTQGEEVKDDVNYDFEVDSQGLPILNSNPNSKAIIHLDFDGGITSYASQGDIQPYREGDVFTDEEAQLVFKIWHDVAENFAMFDINVTTVAPDKSKNPTAHILCSRGGSSFAAQSWGEPDQEADRASALANVGYGRSLTSSYATHELGHLVGLLPHQAAFDADGNLIDNYRTNDEWLRSPFLGSYDASSIYGHWSNNTAVGGVVVDEVPRMAADIVDKLESFGFAGGDGFRPDDHSNSFDQATKVEISGEVQYLDLYELKAEKGEAKGIIERFNDIDSFEFDWSGGHACISATATRCIADTFIFASSVGLRLKLFDQSGNIIATNFEENPGDTRAQISQDLPPGKYFVQVSGAQGEGDMGSYFLRIIPPLELSPIDSDGDGITDIEELEQGNDPNSASDFGFDFGISSEGWRRGGKAVSAVVDNSGNLVVVAGATGARTLRSNLSFNGSEVPVLEIRYQSTGSGNLKLYWGVDSDTASYAYSSSRLITLPRYNSGDGWVTQVIDMRNHPSWMNEKITDLRIDVMSGTASAPKHTWIDHIVSAADLDSDGDGMNNLTELEGGYDPNSASDFGFDFGVSSEGWRRGGKAVSAVVDNSGNLVVVAGGTGARTLRSNLSFNGSEAPVLEIRYQSTGSGNLKLLWGVKSNTASYPYGPPRVITLPQYTSGDGWVTQVIDLRNHPSWMNETITDLRIDVMSGTASEPKHTWIDYLIAQ